MSSRQAATCCQLRCATSKSAAVVVPDSSGGEKNNTTSGATERRDDIGSCELGSSSSISFIFVLFHHLPLIRSSNHLTQITRSFPCFLEATAKKTKKTQGITKDDEPQGDNTKGYTCSTNCWWLVNLPLSKQGTPPEIKPWAHWPLVSLHKALSNPYFWGGWGG